MLASIATIIAALPQILSLVKNLISFFEAKLGPDWVNKLSTVNEAFTQLTNAKTPEDYQNAATALAKSINGNG